MIRFLHRMCYAVEAWGERRGKVIDGPTVVIFAVEAVAALLGYTIYYACS